MKIIKLSSILLLSLFFMGAFMPQVSAKNHRCKSRTSFGLSFNVAPTPRSYATYNYVTPAPAPVAVMPYGYAPVAPVPAYYPYPAYQQVVVQRPYVAPAYVGPQFSYSYWRY